MLKTQFNQNCLFLSPHLDDVVLSCASFITSLIKKKHNVLVLSIFTKSTAEKNTKFTKNYLKKSGFTNEINFFRFRHKEDKKALNFLKCQFKHLNFTDAAWRQKINLSLLETFLLKIYPFTSFIYPRDKDIFSGKIKDNIKYLKNIEIRIKKIIKQFNNYSLFIPLGIGKHVDHLIIKKIGEQLNNNVIYYEDFPYNYDFSQKYYKKNLINQITKKEHLKIILKEENINWKTKVKAIKFYKSQFRVLFDNQTIPKIPEKYYQKNES